MREQREVLSQIPEMCAHKGNFSQYLRDDLTIKQRQQHRQLVIERNKRNEALPEGESRWKVYKMRLVRAGN